MSGTVFEWSLTDYQNPRINAANENTRSAVWRVLRDGSWYNPRSLECTTCCAQHDRLNCFDTCGFRFVRRPVYPCGA